MRAEHLKGWLAEARMEDAEAAKVAAVEGTTEVNGGTGGEEAEEIREKKYVEMTTWERVVALVREDFGE